MDLWKSEFFLVVMCRAISCRKFVCGACSSPVCASLQRREEGLEEARPPALRSCPDLPSAIVFSLAKGRRGQARDNSENKQ